MGNCASPQNTREIGGINWASTAKVIQLDGRLQEFKKPIKAIQILTHNPNSFLCSSETMFIGSQVPQMSGEEELQLGQIYFLIPKSKSQTPLSLQDLCGLAIKASSALGNSDMGQKSNFGFSVGPQGSCRVPGRGGVDMVGVNSRVAGGRRRIELYD